jgi:hypothetical protein
MSGWVLNGGILYTIVHESLEGSIAWPIINCSKNELMGQKITCQLFDRIKEENNPSKEPWLQSNNSDYDILKIQALDNLYRHNDIGKTSSPIHP